MSKENNGNLQQDQINKVAWKACDTFRGVVDPSEYKNYILVFLFLKYLSDAWRDKEEEYRKEVKDEERIKRLMSREKFVLPKHCSYYDIFEQRNETNIGEIINHSLEEIEEANKSKLEGVFRNIDFNSESNLGQTKDRNRRLKNLIEDFSAPELDLRPSRIGAQDIIGNTYEYLISHFASDAGKKGGEFYTPAQVAQLLAKLLQPKSGNRISDPACGSASLLIHVAKEVGSDNFSLYGQESNGSTWALAKMNIFLHNMDNARLEWGDTINNPKLIEEDKLMKFDVVVANPPFSLDKWGFDQASHDPFNRFHRGVPPKSKGDYAFVTHMIETMNENGKVGVIVPHGVLFRGSSEGRIREQLIEDNLLDAVVGLPPKLFYGTSIPAAILIFKKNKTTKDVLFIDASRDFEEGTKQNVLRAIDIARIVDTYNSRKQTERYAHVASLKEIENNEFNLNIPRYVDNSEKEEEIDIKAVQADIEKIEGELDTVRKEMKKHLKELGL